MTQLVGNFPKLKIMVKIANWIRDISTFSFYIHSPTPLEK